MRQQIAQAVADAFGIARIGDRRGSRAAQAQVLIHLAQQQQLAAAAQVPAAEISLDDTPPEAPETSGLAVRPNRIAVGPEDDKFANSALKTSCHTSAVR